LSLLYYENPLFDLHPHDPALALTFPHHTHMPPDIKRNRTAVARQRKND